METGIKEQVRRGELTAEEGAALLLNRAKENGEESIVMGTKAMAWLRQRITSMAQVRKLQAMGVKPKKRKRK